MFDNFSVFQPEDFDNCQRHALATASIFDV
ncbi:hypothetical protein [Pseudomonas sp. 25 R 14]|nr:hypothetical protein [Pseudomonas sp. 25 R 14]